MQKSIENVLGMKKFKGEIDGKSFDSCSFYVDTRLDDSKGTRRGRCTMEYKAGLSDVFDKFSTVEFPALFELEWETISNGKESSQIITDVRLHKAASVPDKNKAA